MFPCVSGDALDERETARKTKEQIEEQLKQLEQDISEGTFSAGNPQWIQKFGYDGINEIISLFLLWIILKVIWIELQEFTAYWLYFLPLLNVLSLDFIAGNFADIKTD